MVEARSFYGDAVSLPSGAQNVARAQIRVIAALVRRESRVHFGATRIGYLWAVIEPTLHLCVYALLFTYVLRRHSPLGGNLSVFMLSGLMMYFLFSKLATYLAGAIEGNRSLLNLPPVKPLDVLIARAILETATYLLVGVLLFTALAIGGAPDVAPYHPMRLTVAIAGTVALGIGVGIINAVMRAFLHNWMTIFGLILSPVFLLSGIWFLPGQIPPPFRDYLLYNPMMHYIMWARSGLYRGYDPMELDRGYAIAVSAAVLALGLVLLRVSRRKLLEPS